MSLCVLQPWSAKLLWSFVSVICYAECRWCGLRRDLINGFERFCTVHYWWVYRDNAAINSHHVRRDLTKCRFSPIPLPCSINMRSDLISISMSIPDGFSSKRVWCACRRSFSGKWVYSSKKLLHGFSSIWRTLSPDRFLWFCLKAVLTHIRSNIRSVFGKCVLHLPKTWARSRWYEFERATSP